MLLALAFLSTRHWHKKSWRWILRRWRTLFYNASRVTPAHQRMEGKGRFTCIIIHISWIVLVKNWKDLYKQPHFLKSLLNDSHPRYVPVPSRHPCSKFPGRHVLWICCVLTIFFLSFSWHNITKLSASTTNPLCYFIWMLIWYLF